MPAPEPLPEQFLRWFESRGWAPREHQLALLEKARAGRSALLIAPTGAGKTLAGFLPTLVELSRGHATSTGRSVQRSGGLHTLYISPLKALAVDIARNLEKPIAEMKLERHLRLVYRRAAVLSHSAMAFLQAVRAFSTERGKPYLYKPEADAAEKS